MDGQKVERDTQEAELTTTIDTTKFTEEERDLFIEVWLRRRAFR